MYKRATLIVQLLLLITTLAAISYVSSNVYAQELRYRILREYVTLTVESDATCILVYNLTIMVDSGAIRRYVAVGMPNPYFIVIEAREVETGKEISYVEHRDGEYSVEMKVSSPIRAGESRTFILVVEVTNLVFKDETNPGNVGLQFIPSWFPVEVEDLRLTIILPPGVGIGEFVNTPDYDNVFTIDGRVALYWERRGLGPNEKFGVGVSFPQEYLSVEVPSSPAPSASEDEFIDILFAVITILFIIIPVLYVAFRAKKSPYSPPRLMIEALGPRKGLYAPEAAWLIESEKKKPNVSKVLTMILYSLLKKGVVEIVSLSPLKLRKIDTKRRLRYYERAFLKCIGSDGGLSDDCLLKVIDVLDRGVAKKIVGYSRKETINYYRGIVERAWKEVQGAKTPELKLLKAMKNTEWLLLDPSFDSKLRENLSYNTPILFEKPYVWRSLLPPSERSSGSVSIVELADNVATSIERIATNIVQDIETFTERVVSHMESKAQSQASRSRPIYSTSCACVSCACVCACVSCACACASGGAG